MVSRFSARPLIIGAVVALAAGGLLGGCGSQATVGPTVATQQVTTRYAVHRSTSSYGVIFSFDGSNGAYPAANLIDVRGTLFGTTPSGGRGCRGRGCGTAFSVTTTGQESVLYRFRLPRVRGSSPAARLTFLNGTFYGTTQAGGSIFGGTVFSIARAGEERVLHSFGPAPSDGLYPAAGLIPLNGTFYGTTNLGGSDGAGTVYSITPSGTERVIYNFQGFNGGHDGAYPLDLIVANGVLYGTTIGGGPDLWGTIFKVTTSGTETVLHEFKGGSDGTYPDAGLIHMNGKFYGTTTRGGDSHLCKSSGEVGCGIVFAMTSAGKESVLYRFKGGTDGQFPEAPLVALNGALYGTTSAGGANGFGTIFRVTAAGNESVLYSFTGKPDGELPYAGLTKIGGTLYGMTSGGGTNGYGTIFAITP